ncbi:ATP-binding protein [Geodermatophilus sp. SYSU D00710]
MNAHWQQRPPPDLATGAAWQGAPRTAAELTALRADLHHALRDGPLATGAVTAAADAAADAIDTALLTFEELASNGLRHGRPPVHVMVTAAGAGWLLEVSDAAADRPPTPATGRDPARGGHGLHLVARLCAAHGWFPRDGRKYVWAYVAPADVASRTSPPPGGRPRL